jgi:predicted nucleotidyltransferase
MPVRSLTSPVLKWPDAQTVAKAARRWAEKIAQARPDLVQIGYFGSYARGDWGVGSDLDLIIILDHTDKPFEARSVEFDTSELPVPADVLVYTLEEWRSLAPQRRFFQTLAREAVWIYERSQVIGKEV